MSFQLIEVLKLTVLFAAFLGSYLFLLEYLMPSSNPTLRFLKSK